MTAQATPIEELAIFLAHEMNDSDVVFTGLVTGERAALFAAGVPLAAAMLARKTHAPNLTVLLAGWLVNPDLSQLTIPPQSEFDPVLMDLPCEARCPGYPNVMSVHRGDVTLGFSSGAQIDRFGALNTHRIHKPDGGIRSLVGPILVPEHMTRFGREFVMMPRHDRRTFVPRVDYRSSPRLDDQRRLASAYGYKGRGASLVVTPLGVFDFSDTGTMQLRSIHRHASRQEILDNTGFELTIADDVPVTPEATREYLDILRGDVDPRGLLLGRE